MRKLVHDVSGGLYSLVAGLLMLAEDYFLLSVFRSHIQRSFAFPHYRPVYTRSGRRNRVRC